MPPEYLVHGQLTEKVDVYSFGVLLLEIVTGRQNNKTKTIEYSSECLDNLITIVSLKLHLASYYYYYKLLTTFGPRKSGNFVHG